MFESISDWVAELPQRLDAHDAELSSELREVEHALGMPVPPRDLARKYTAPPCEASDQGRPERALRAIGRFLDQGIDGQHRLILAGDAGSGKTSTAVMLKLASLVGLWPEDGRLVLIRIGPGTTDDVQGLQHPSRTTVVLDGLDEDRAAWGNTGDRLRQLLELTARFQRVIITCRTDFLPGDNVCPTMVLFPLDDSQVKEYLQTHHPAGWRAWSKTLDRPPLIEDARDLFDLLSSEAFRSLFLAHVDGLAHTRRIAWSDYGLCEALLAAWIARTVGQAHPALDGAALVRGCEALARCMATSGMDEVPPADLGRVIDDEQVACFIDEMKIHGASILNRSPSGGVRFAHPLLRDYLTVRLISENRFGEDELSYCSRETLPPAKILESGCGLPAALGSKLSSQAEALLTSYLKVEIFRRLSIRSSAPDASSQERATGPAMVQIRKTADRWNVALRGTLQGLRAEGYQLSWRGPVSIQADYRGLDFTDSKLDRAFFGGANLSKASFVNAQLVGANLDGANLTKADFRGAVLSHSKLARAKLLGANLTAADLSSAKAYRADLDEATLREATLANADLREANLSTANLTGANLARTDLTRAKLIGTNLRKADLSGANLQGATLCWANLTGANLVNADLTGADLSHASFSSTDLTGSPPHTVSLDTPSSEGNPLREKE